MKRPNIINVRFVNWRRTVPSPSRLILVFLVAFLTAFVARAEAEPFHLMNFQAPNGESEIIAKVLALKTSRLSHKDMPIQFTDGVTLYYKIQVIFSSSAGIKIGATVGLIGKRTAGGYYVFGGPGAPGPVNWRDPIMRPGSIFVASVVPIKVRGVFEWHRQSRWDSLRLSVVPTKTMGVFEFGNPGILPIGLPIPSPVSSTELKPVEEGLRAWNEARRSFNFYPYADVLPKNQATVLMKSHNFYLWALGVSSYCGGADKAAIKSLINEFFYRPKPISISLPDGQTYRGDLWQGPRLSTRRAAWLLYAMALFPNPWYRPTVQTVVSLMAQTACRRPISQGRKYNFPAAAPWAYTNEGRYSFVSGTPIPGYEAAHTASVAEFLKEYEIRRKAVGKPMATVPVNREK